MGYNMLWVIYNDHLSSIAKSGDFGRRIQQASHEEWMTHKPVSIPGGYLVAQYHADDTGVAVTGRNMGQMLIRSHLGNPTHPDTQIRLLKELADRLGYELRKKPEKANARK